MNIIEKKMKKKVAEKKIHEANVDATACTDDAALLELKLLRFFLTWRMACTNSIICKWNNNEWMNDTEEDCW